MFYLNTYIKTKMTKQEKTGKRDNHFSKWMRKMLPDSSTGYYVTDIDFVLHNWKKMKKPFMLLEIKSNSRKVEITQHNIYEFIHKCIVSSIAHGDEHTKGWVYLGFNLIRFTGYKLFEDGDCYFNNLKVTEEELISFLSF